MAKNNRGVGILSPIPVDGSVHLPDFEKKDAWYQQLNFLSITVTYATPILVMILFFVVFLVEKENIETLALYSGVLSLVFLLLCFCTFERRLIKQRCNYVKSCSLVWVIVLALSFDSYFKLGLFF